MQSYSILLILLKAGYQKLKTRIFLEISARLKGRKVKIWVGQELTNKRAIEKLNKK